MNPVKLVTFEDLFIADVVPLIASKPDQMALIKNLVIELGTFYYQYSEVMNLTFIASEFHNAGDLTELKMNLRNIGVYIYAKFEEHREGIFDQTALLTADNIEPDVNTCAFMHHLLLTRFFIHSECQSVRAFNLFDWAKPVMEHALSVPEFSYNEAKKLSDSYSKFKLKYKG